MNIQFRKRLCCHDAGRVVAEIESADLRELAEWLTTVCAYQMGDDCYAQIIPSLERARDIYGDDLPSGLVAAFSTSAGGVLESSNGCPPEYLSLPPVGTEAYYRAIIDDLTGRDWGDCDVAVETRGEALIAALRETLLAAREELAAWGHVGSIRTNRWLDASTRAEQLLNANM